MGVFPADLEACVDVGCAAVYSLLLDPAAHGVVEVGGIPCVTLGHQFTDNAVVAHDYYGSSKVVEDLQRMPGFSSGLLWFRHGSVARGPDGQVLGFDSSRLKLPRLAGRLWRTDTHVGVQLCPRELTGEESRWDGARCADTATRPVRPRLCLCENMNCHGSAIEEMKRTLIASSPLGLRRRATNTMTATSQSSSIAVPFCWR